MLKNTKNHAQQNGINKYILAVVILSLMLPMTFMAGFVLASSVQDGFLLTSDSLSSWISALATVAIAVLTIILAKETWYLREAQSNQLEEMRRDSIRPHIDISLNHGRVGVHFMDLRIANSGKGVAKNIKFSLADEIDGISHLGMNPLVDSVFKLGAISNGISNLGTGQTYKSYVFSFIDVMKAIGHDKTFSTKFYIGLNYSDIHGYEYADIVLFDISSYSGIIELGGADPIYTMSKSLEKIQTLLKGVTKSNKIKVDVYNQLDRLLEKEEFEKMVERYRAKNEKTQDS